MGIRCRAISAARAPASPTWSMSATCSAAPAPSTGMIYAMHQIKVACLVRHGAPAPGTSAAAPAVRRTAAARLLDDGGPGRRRCAQERGADRAAGRASRSSAKATVISYGEEADGVVTTARRAADAATTDQVLVVFLKRTTARTAQGWDALGMRGTCSAGFMLKSLGHQRSGAAREPTRRSTRGP